MTPEVENGRWRDLELLISRRGGYNGPMFDPSMNQDGSVTAFLAEVPVLCVGAGGLGCEILKDLALTGFHNIHVIDLDTIDVTNLNRQFLFSVSDVGRPKAEAAAEKVQARVSGTTVTPYFCRIEDKPNEWYEQFDLIILGLDSLEARRYMNSVVCSFLEFDADGAVKPETVKAMIDGGTEGLKGHARVIKPGSTPCFECTLWLFPPQVKFPMCTLAETPRSAAHCIEYAHLVQWGKSHDVEFDSDNERHMLWVYEQAKVRSVQFGITGVTLQHTQGVVKNIIPAIPSTNAIIAAACVAEALKLITDCLPVMKNCMMYMGTEAIYTHTVNYSKEESCSICGCGPALTVPYSCTLRQVMAAMMADSTIGPQIAEPSISSSNATLYMRGPLEQMYRDNLEITLVNLIPGLTENMCATMMITDRKLKNALRVRLLLDPTTMPPSQ